MTTGNQKYHSSIISHRLPEFIQTNNPTMVAFVQAYYEWLEQQSKEGYVRTPMALNNSNDVDQTLDQFVEMFKNEYLLNFPESFAITDDGNTVNVRQLIKNIKEFYRNKGTEKTYEFLFRILYDAAVEFYYPARDILRLSDGKWIEKKSIRCSNESGNKIFDARGKVVFQRSTDGSIIASGRVIDVFSYQLGTREVCEIFLTNVNGQFRANGSFASNYGGIEFTDNDGKLQREPKVYSVLSDLKVTNGGSDYRKGERIFFQPSIRPYLQNLLKYSQEFDNKSFWLFPPEGRYKSLLPTSKTAAPDGSYTAYRFVPTTTSSGSGGSNYFTSKNEIRFENGKYYTISAYVKPDDYGTGYLRLSNSNRSSYIQVVFNTFPDSTNTSNGVDNSTNADSSWQRVENRKLISVGNGWYRVSFTAQYIGTTITNGKVDVFLGRGAYNNSLLQTATTDYGIFVWGLQVNESSSFDLTHPTTYAKTEAFAPLELMPTNDTGEGAVGTIIEVDSNGSVIKTRIDNFGVGYEATPTYTIDTKFGSGASVEPTIGTICKYSGYYSGNDGRLSTNKVMQDNHFYQNFSYVLLSEIVIDRYKEILRTLIHPAGMGMFGKVVVNRCSSTNPITDTTIKKTDTEVLGNYSPYTLYTNIDIGELLYNGRPTPYYPSLHDTLILGASGNPPDLQLFSLGQNYLNYSSDLPNWKETGASPSINPSNYTLSLDGTLSPDGSEQAYLVKRIYDPQIGPANGQSLINRTISWNSSSSTATFSIYFKLGPLQSADSDLPPTQLTYGYIVQVNKKTFPATTLVKAKFQFVPTEELIVEPTPYGSATVESLPDYWYRMKITINTPEIQRVLLPNGTYQNKRLEFLVDNPIETSFPTYGERGIYLWGSQIEEGTVARTLLNTKETPVIHRSYAVGFNPKDISGLKLWLDGKSLTAVGATVGSWRDSSGNGYTASAYRNVSLPSVSVMGGLHLTGSVGTFGSVLTTPNFDIGERTLFAAFTPYPVSDGAKDFFTSQKNSMIVGVVRGQSNNGTTGAATGHHFQSQSICVDYERAFVEGNQSTDPKLLFNYGVGNYGGATALAVTNRALTASFVASESEVSAGRFSPLFSKSSQIEYALNDLSFDTTNNPNTLIVSSVIDDGGGSLTASYYSSNNDINRKYDRKSNDDFSEDARYYRYQKIATHRISYSEIGNSTYKFQFDLSGNELPPYYWKAVLTKNEFDLDDNATYADIPKEFVVAEWTWAGFADNATSPTESRTYETIVKNLQAEDYISLWVSPCDISGAKPLNSTLNTANPYTITLSNFVITKVYSQGKNFAVVNGNEIGTAVSSLKGMTSGQRLTIGLGQNYFNGVLHEVLLYDRALNKRERETVEAYLHYRWKNDIIRADKHSWNLPILSLTAGIYPALNTEGGVTATSTLQSSLGYPFFEIAHHPNTFLVNYEDPYPARIFNSIKSDFLGSVGDGKAGYWPEWVISDSDIQNYFTYSTDPTKWGSGQNYSVLPRQQIAPNGTNTGALLTKLNNNPSTLLRKVVWQSVEPKAVYSVYIKKPSTNGRRYANFVFRNNSTGTNLSSVTFDFTNEVFVNQNGNSLGVQVSNSFGKAQYINGLYGWIRIVISVTNGISKDDELWLYYGDSENTEGLGLWQTGESLYVWGIQLEEGDFASELTETSDSPIRDRSANRKNWATGLSSAGTTGSKIAMLKYNESSEFRKITAQAFLDRKLGRQFDCRNEVIVEPPSPMIELQYCPSFGAQSPSNPIYTNGTIVFNYSVLNDSSMEYWITNQLEVEISDGRKLYRTRPESQTWNGKFSISGFTSRGTGTETYTVTFRLKDYYGNTVPNSEASLFFYHRYADLPSPFDTLTSCT
jgi:hypothetical protein